MISNRNLPKITIILVFLYFSLFILDLVIFKGTLFQWGCGKSFNNIQKNEGYRLLTGSFFHSSILHLLGNTFAIYCVGTILENKIGSFNFLLIYLMGNIVEGLVSAKYSNYISGCGASPGIYALIACILILYFSKTKTLNLSFNDWAFNYTIWYFFLGNFIGLRGLVAHSIGFSSGVVVSTILLLIGILK